ncbi:unnamed protein product [Lathyrus oleraceus]
MKRNELTMQPNVSQQRLTQHGDTLIYMTCGDLSLEISGCPGFPIKLWLMNHGRECWILVMLGIVWIVLWTCCGNAFTCL